MSLFNFTTGRKFGSRLLKPFKAFVKSPLSNVGNPNVVLDESNSAALLDDRQWAEEQAQKQMDFQKMMSDTSWQRGVDDMQKAGLNPALAYMQGGASAAGGVSADTNSTAQQASLQRERLMYELANTALGTLGKAIPTKRNITGGTVNETFHHLARK